MSERHIKLLKKAANKKGNPVVRQTLRRMAQHAHSVELLLAMHQIPRYATGFCVSCGALPDKQPRGEAHRPDCPVARYEELTNE